MLGPILQGHRIRLEPAQLEDAPLRQRWFSDLEVTRLYTSPSVPSMKQEEESFDHAARDDSVVLWRITLDGVSIDQSFLYELDWMHRQTRSGMGIGARMHWGKGYGSEGVQLRTAYALGAISRQSSVPGSRSTAAAVACAVQASGSTLSTPSTICRTAHDVNCRSSTSWGCPTVTVLRPNPGTNRAELSPARTPIFLF